MGNKSNVTLLGEASFMPLFAGSMPAIGENMLTAAAIMPAIAKNMLTAATIMPAIDAIGLIFAISMLQTADFGLIFHKYKLKICKSNSTFD